MKFNQVIASWLLGLSVSANASIYLAEDLNQVIPDNDRNGVQSTIMVNDLPGGLPISDVNVTINVTGGYNGDLYAYLTHGDVIVVLLNRVGRTATDEFGYADSGFHITLDDQANTDVHRYQTVAYALDGGALTGSWKPDARTSDPASVLDTDSRGASLDTFNGMNGNGSWTLFFADLSLGEISTLQGWSMEISVVPEPSTYALIIFAGAFAIIQFARWRRARARLAVV